MKVEERETGDLFGKLFPVYDHEAFVHSMRLLPARFQANNFPLEWFKGKNILDVGCGGGRYTLALAALGAEKCIGIDLAPASIRDAEKRARDLNIENVEFKVGSAVTIPFDDHSFDGVLFSGVLQHVAEPVTVLNELARVTRSGGMLYLLVYATEGVRWPLIQMLRPIAQTIGFENMDHAIGLAGLSISKRRTYLDDLFVPYIDYYSWQCLENLLHDKGFSSLDRWAGGRLDHEENLESYLLDLTGLAELFNAAALSSVGGIDAHQKKILQSGVSLCQSAISYVEVIIADVLNGHLLEDLAMKMVVGQGHHRVVAWKD